MNHKPNELSGGQRSAWPLPERWSTALDHSGRRATGNLDSKTGLEIMALFDTLHATQTPLCWSPTSPTSPNTPIAWSIFATAKSSPTSPPSRFR